eukprot:scpid11003/ scgid31448/ Golgin subfamily A member 3; Golgin-160; Male-enhanced antigen 2
MMAQSVSDTEHYGDRGQAFKLDFPQRTEPRPAAASSTTNSSSTALTSTGAVAGLNNSGPGGVYAHSRFTLPPTDATSANKARISTVTSAGVQPSAVPASITVGPTRSDSPVSNTSRNQLVNPSYSPIDAKFAVPLSDRPQEAFSMPPSSLPTGAPTAVTSATIGGEPSSTMQRATPAHSVPTTPVGSGVRMARSVSGNGPVMADARHRASLSSVTTNSAAATAVAPLTTASLMERLEKYRTSGVGGGASNNNGIDGASLASSREQDAMQLRRVGSLSSLAAVTTANGVHAVGGAVGTSALRASSSFGLPSSSSGGIVVGTTPTRSHRGGPLSSSFTAAGVSPSSARYQRPPSVTQSLAGGTRTAEIEAKLQRTVQDKAHLEGKLEALTAECRLALKQRSDLQQQLATAQARCEAHSGTAEAATKREQQLREDLADMSQQLHEALQRQSQAANQHGADWSTVEEIQDQCGELQQALEQLRKSSAEQVSENAKLHASLQAAQADTHRAEEERARMARDLTAFASDKAILEENNNVLQDQLDSARAATESVRADLSAAHSAALKLSVDLERERVLTTDRDSQLRRLQSQTLQQQGNILSSLEDFEAETAAREDSLQRQAREKESAADELEKAYREAARESAELLRGQTQLKAQLQAMERQAAEFKQLAEGTLADRKAAEDEVMRLREHQAQLDNELDRAAQALAGHEQSTSALRTEVYVAEQAAAMEQDKRRQLEEDLQRLRSNMLQLEDGLQQVQREAESREQEVDEERQRILGEVDEERQRNAQREAELEDALSRTTTDQRARSLQLEKLEQEREAMQSDAAQLSAKHAQLTEQLVACKAAAGDAERNAVAAQRTATDANRRLEEERQHAEVQLRAAAATHEMELERALGAKVAAEAEAERARMQLEAHQQGVEAELRAAVETATQAHRQLQEQHRALAGRLTDAERLKERAEHEAVRSAKRAERLQQDAAALENELSSANNTRALAENALGHTRQEAEQREAELNDQIVALQEELDEAIQLQQAAREEAQAVTNQLAEELERERGRVEGITSAQATLRDHAGNLEAELANREYSLGQLSSQTANVLADKLAEDEAVGRKVQRLTSELEVAKEDNARLQQQLESGAGRDRASTSELRLQLQQSTADAQRFAEEVSRLRQLLSTSAEQEKKFEERMSQSSLAVRTSQHEVDQLKRALLETASKESTTSEKLRTLSWENEQLAIEVAALKEQNTLAETRHQREVESLRQPLLSNDASPDTRFSLLTSHGLARSKPALHQQFSADSAGGGVTSTDGPTPTALSSLPSASSSIRAAGGMPSAVSAESPALPGGSAASGMPARDVTSVRGQLGRKHKTISGLQTCLSSLRGEMEKLQQQMARQSDAVQASNSTCRALETRLRGIKPGGSTSSLHRIGVSPTSATPPPPQLSRPERDA